MGLKVCSRCRDAKPIDEFPNNKKSKDGKHCYCRPCLSDYRREWVQKNQERHAEYHRKYREEHREEAAIRQRDWRIRNSARDKANSQRYYQENKERFRENMLRWRASNPERAREILRLNQRKRKARQAGAATYVILDKDVRRLLGGMCAVAGCGERDRLTIDHIVPLARGGSHGIGNLQALCAKHNSSKNKKLWIEFRVYLRNTEVRCG